jgi:hypothetical protein
MIMGLITKNRCKFANLSKFVEHYFVYSLNGKTFTAGHGIYGSVENGATALLASKASLLKH